MRLALVAGLALAAGLWLVLFSPWTAGLIPFWPGLTGATALLACHALAFGRDRLKTLLKFRFRWVSIGLLSAILFYLVFFIGNAFSRMLLAGAERQIGQVYQTGVGRSPWVLALLLVVVGTAEEIFWRGFVQMRFVQFCGGSKGLLIAALVYAGVHVWALNFMLVSAALLCGLFWGAMALKFKSLWPGIVSHAVWDVTVFVLLPFG